MFLESGHRLMSNYYKNNYSIITTYYVQPNKKDWKKSQRKVPKKERGFISSTPPLLTLTCLIPKMHMSLSHFCNIQCWFSLHIIFLSFFFFHVFFLSLKSFTKCHIRFCFQFFSLSSLQTKYKASYLLNCDEIFLAIFSLL